MTRRTGRTHWDASYDICYRLTGHLTHGSKKYFVEEAEFKIIDSTEISDTVWSKTFQGEGVYWFTRDFSECFEVYIQKEGETDENYWHLYIPNSKKPIFRQPVNLSFGFKSKLYSSDGLPIDVSHYLCYNDRVQVVDVNGKVFDGPFFE